jgi:hypothetical protein
MTITWRSNDPLTNRAGAAALTDAGGLVIWVGNAGALGDASPAKFCEDMDENGCSVALECRARLLPQMNGVA